MTELHNGGLAEERREKRSWRTPTLTRLEAADAEVGTRKIVVDGGFTSS